MKISKDEVNYIAKLAKLRFNEEEAERLAKEFDDILSHFQSIDKMNLEDVDINKPDENKKTVLRKDETCIFIDKKKLFQNTKDIQDGSIRIPKVIE
jgi:aspartyl-tRNA(Asn)/glutamyl-tRNA(Gln) amidotransferase subunit C